MKNIRLLILRFVSVVLALRNVTNIEQEIINKVTLIKVLVLVFVCKELLIFEIQSKNSLVSGNLKERKSLTFDRTFLRSQNDLPVIISYFS